MSHAPAPSPRRSLLSRLLLVPVLAAGALALSVAPASAHSGMTGSDPADGATVDVAPDAVTLTFNEPPQALGTEVAIVGPDGATVSEGVTTVADTAVIQTLAAARPAGAYVIQWRVTSADGHPLSGELTFTAATGTGSAETAGGSTPPEPEPIDETATPSAEETVAAAAPSDPQEERVTWQWGPTSVGVLIAIAAAVAALVVVAIRLRRRDLGAPDDSQEPGER